MGVGILLRQAGQAILTTPNHILQFLSPNPNYRLDLNKIYMLKSLTQFEIRVREQAIISYFKPNLNSSHSIIYSFINWNPAHIPSIRNNIKLKVFNASNGTISRSNIINNIGLITEFDSIGSAAIALSFGVFQKLSRYINTISSLESPLLEFDVFIIDPNRPLTNKAVSFAEGETKTTKFLPEITDFDLYSLPMGKLVALNSNKDPIAYYGVFKNAAEAALVLDNKTEFKYISRYINLERTVEVTSKKDLVYFVMNPMYKQNISLRRTPESRL